MRRRKGWAALLLALLVLAAAEQVARPYFREPRNLFHEHPVRFWALNPGTITRDQQSDSFIHVNSLGLRGEEFDASRPGPRILLLGDSCIFGAGLKDEETPDRFLEPELRARTGQPWTVFNGGVPGYSTFQGLDLFGEVGPVLRADVVVFAYLYADRGLDPCPDDERQAGRPVSDLRRLLWKSSLYRLARARVLGWPVDQTLRVEDINRRGRRERVPTPRYVRNLQALAGLARDFGARQVVFLRLPNLTPGSDQAGGQERALRDVDPALGVLADAYGIWRDAGLLQPSAFLPNDSLHFSPEGSRQLARTLAEDLERQGVLGPGR